MPRATLFVGFLLAACSSTPENAPGGGIGGASAGGAGTGGSAVAVGGVSGGGGAVIGGSAGVSGSGGGVTAAGAGGSGSGGVGGSAGGVSGGAGAGGASGAAGAGGAVALEPCEEPSVSRLKVWEMQVVGGTQVPANGSPLKAVPAGGHELDVQWTLNGGGYGTANAPLENQGEYANGANPAEHAVDIGGGPGITVEYSSTGNTYLQIRTASVPHGGDHFRADLPSTDGAFDTIVLAYDTFRRPGGNAPPGNDILSDAYAFTFVGGGTTHFKLRQVLIPGYVPPCD